MMDEELNKLKMESIQLDIDDARLRTQLAQINEKRADLSKQLMELQLKQDFTYTMTYSLA